MSDELKDMVKEVDKLLKKKSLIKKHEKKLRSVEKIQNTTLEISLTT